MLRLGGGERFGERIGNLFIGGAVDKSHEALFDNVTDEVKTDVNMFCTCVVLVVFSEFDGRFVIGKEGGWGEFNVEKLVDEGTKPDGFFHGMGYSNVFGLGSR